ncbi:hypothetical protein [Streptomyces rugosispiralis]|uniref:Lipoprotein CseA n=1 Tax=Streptomyces rugosispiralis TaxID=2967341 RepID=A0ABT1V826_9ACTN|nr:hypothetical protein [Streptomyces rugosispiralis]MCQ8193538.1 hypothetical protein [Streptomyces rugosispiralis]
MLTGGAVVGLAAAGGWMLAGCGDASQGVRKEGPASTEWASAAADSGAYAGGRASGRPSPAAGKKVDVIKLVKADPQVSDDLKTSLKPCPTAKERETKQEIKGYPVDVTSGRLTGSADSDLVINVMSCTDGFGIGSYVYRKVGDRYENVFSDEQPPVYADVAKDELRVTKLSYTSGDSVCCPSSETVITYGWSGADRSFAVRSREHNDYSKNVPKQEATPVPTARADDGTEG